MRRVVVCRIKKNIEGCTVFVQRNNALGVDRIRAFVQITALCQRKLLLSGLHLSWVFGSWHPDSNKRIILSNIPQLTTTHDGCRAWDNEALWLSSVQEMATGAVRFDGGIWKGVSEHAKQEKGQPEWHVSMRAPICIFRTNRFVAIAYLPMRMHRMAFYWIE